MESHVQRVLAIGILSAGLVACSTRIPYTEVANGPTAKLSLIAGPGSTAANVAIQADANCKRLNMLATLSLIPDRVNQFGAIPVVREKSFNVPADEALRVQVEDLHPGHALATCNSAAEFKPVSGGEYKLIWSFERQQCQIQLLEKTSSGQWASVQSAQSVRTCHF